MLTLTRKPGQEIIIGDNIRIVVKEIRGKQVRLGISAPAGVLISRGEVHPDSAGEPDNATGHFPGLAPVISTGVPVLPAGSRESAVTSSPSILSAQSIRFTRGTRRPPQLV